MITLVSILVWAALTLFAIGIFRDAKNIRRYKKEQAEAESLAQQAVDRLLVGDLDGAIALAYESRQHHEKALDIMMEW